MIDKNKCISKLRLAGFDVVDATSKYVIYKIDRFGLIDLVSGVRLPCNYTRIKVLDNFYILYYNNGKIEVNEIYTNNLRNKALKRIKNIQVDYMDTLIEKSTDIILCTNTRTLTGYLIHKSGKELKITDSLVGCNVGLNDFILEKEGKYYKLYKTGIYGYYSYVENNVRELLLTIDENFNIIKSRR